MGYTEFSWDNFSGQEVQPSSSGKAWTTLTNEEKAAARVLGYTGTTWDNESGAETQPASNNKYWVQLTSCGESRCILHKLFLAEAFSSRACH